jgi:hypothetical protein
MPRFRVYLEEIATQLISTTIDASTPDEAEAWARAALEDGTWSEWADRSGDQCEVDVRDDLITLVTDDGRETPLRRGHLDQIAAVVLALPASLHATLEYPGWVCVPLTDIHHAAFGTANGYWAGELVATDTGEVVAALPLRRRPSPATTDPNIIASAITLAVATFRADHD